MGDESFELSLSQLQQITWLCPHLCRLQELQDDQPSDPSYTNTNTFSTNSVVIDLDPPVTAEASRPDGNQ